MCCCVCCRADRLCVVGVVVCIGMCVASVGVCVAVCVAGRIVCVLLVL